jgi:hypothetical protein
MLTAAWARTCLATTDVRAVSLVEWRCGGVAQAIYTAQAYKSPRRADQTKVQGLSVFLDSIETAES